jgi:hypothetical protein
MSFKPEMISDFKSSMSFLVSSMLETMSRVARERIMSGKQSHHVQTEKFSSFFDKISDNEEMLTNLSKKVVVPVFNSHSLSLLSPLIGADGKVEDSFLKIEKEGEDDSSFKIKTTPDGVFFQISKVFLPISEVYTDAVRITVANRSENLPYPNKILLGLYSTIFHSIKDCTPADQLEIIESNVKTLVDSLDSYEEPVAPKREAGPMGMIKNILGNIDFNQIGDMMQKVSGDENSSKEFGEVFGKISDTIKGGGNPLEAMNDIIKQVTVNAAMGENAQEDGADDTGATDDGATDDTGDDTGRTILERRRKPRPLRWLRSKYFQLS